MRIEDKIQRSFSITNNDVNLVNDEGIKDTLLDLHNYAAMTLMLLSENNQNTENKKTPRTKNTQSTLLNYFNS